jgi:ribosomal protein L37AE/L43A
MQCSSCGFECKYDSVFGYWKCQECPAVFAFDADDPDYDEEEGETDEGVMGWFVPLKAVAQNG